MMEERQAMTEEQIKFWFNSMYRHIKYSGEFGFTFGELVDWANKRKIDDEVFLWILDGMEANRLVTRQGEKYMALEQVEH
jgi:hypothetical protein